MGVDSYDTLSSRIDVLADKISNLTDELRSARHELERQIGDEQSDRERADDSIRNDLSSLEHKVIY